MIRTRILNAAIIVLTLLMLWQLGRLQAQCEAEFGTHSAMCVD